MYTHYFIDSNGQPNGKECIAQQWRSDQYFGGEIFRESMPLFQVSGPTSQPVFMLNPALKHTGVLRELKDGDYIVKRSNGYYSVWSEEAFEKNWKPIVSETQSIPTSFRIYGDYVLTSGRKVTAAEYDGVFRSLDVFPISEIGQTKILEDKLEIPGGQHVYFGDVVVRDEETGIYDVWEKTTFISCLERKEAPSAKQESDPEIEKAVYDFLDWAEQLTDLKPPARAKIYRHINDEERCVVALHGYEFGLCTPEELSFFDIKILPGGIFEHDSGDRFWGVSGITVFRELDRNDYTPLPESKILGSVLFNLVYPQVYETQSKPVINTRHAEPKDVVTAVKTEWSKHAGTEALARIGSRIENSQADHDKSSGPTEDPKGVIEQDETIMKLHMERLKDADIVSVVAIMEARHDMVLLWESLRDPKQKTAAVKIIDTLDKMIIREAKL